VGISTYAPAVVGALTVASCAALYIAVALDRRARSRKTSGYTMGGRVLWPTASSGLSSKHPARVGTPRNTPRADRPKAHRRRPLTADQQATRDAWARWRAEQDS
jgi:hypothetical protein